MWIRASKQYNKTKNNDEIFDESEIEVRRKEVGVETPLRSPVR